MVIRGVFLQIKESDQMERCLDVGFVIEIGSKKHNDTVRQ